MRVTESMLDLSNAGNLQRLSERVFQAQVIATSGDSVGRASADPAAAAALVRLDDQRAEAGQYQRNIDRSMAGLDVAESSLASAAEVVQRARELALALANGTVNAEDRQAAIEEVHGLREQLIGLANANDGESYVFAGFRGDQAAFSSAGLFQGDAGVKRIEVGAGVTVDVGVDGASAFAPAAGGQDVFAALSALEVALGANDGQGLADAAGALEVGREQLTYARARVGRQLDELSRHSASLADKTVMMEARRAEIGDASAVEALSELVAAQQALNSAVQIAGRTMTTLSLVNRL